MFTLRPYCPEDLPQVLKLFRSCVHTVCRKEYTPAQLEAWAPEKMDEEAWGKSLASHWAFVAEQDGILLGFADLEEPDYFDRLYVSETSQRQGIASALAQCMEDRARELGAKKLLVHASLTAKGFFLHRGYRELYEQQVERHGQKLTNFGMEKTL
ncbi:MAG TPA: GNAT family N-acetyltransferase [Candidatus Gallacutalibacter pullistercoris]|nr:GNAT family N-acetyltransferase [Candidatus Gallacutalibacter pullistercoris]